MCWMQHVCNDIVKMSLIWSDDPKLGVGQFIFKESGGKDQKRNVVLWPCYKHSTSVESGHIERYSRLRLFVHKQTMRLLAPHSSEWTYCSVVSGSEFSSDLVPRLGTLGWKAAELGRVTQMSVVWSSFKVEHKGSATHVTSASSRALGRKTGHIVTNMDHHLRNIAAFRSFHYIRYINDAYLNGNNLYGYLVPNTFWGALVALST